MMPLTMAKAGETVTIKKITGKDEIRLHLAELGFVVDSEVTVVNEMCPLCRCVRRIGCAARSATDISHRALFRYAFRPSRFIMP